MKSWICSNLEFIRRVYNYFSKNEKQPLLPLDYTGQVASNYIRNMLMSDKPCMIARFGSIELDCVINYLSINSREHILSKIVNYITDKKAGFWWEKDIKKQIYNNAGFFPYYPEYLTKFAELMLSCCPQVDVLGSWRPRELLLKDYLISATIVHLEDLWPYCHGHPWSIALKGKKVLVIHPFSKSIRMQYEKRKELFQNQDVLPEFKLDTLTAVQSIAGVKTKYTDWFAALEDMQKQIVKKDFDVAIIGCGAYGFPLAAFVKKLGKKAVHLGGATQILFGIKGRRWTKDYKYGSNLYNKYWVHPLPEETPEGFRKVEGGCYW
jgi:hypothetical protein